MVRPQRFRNRVLLTEPFSQVNHLATFRAKGAVKARKPVPFPFAFRAFDAIEFSHNPIYHKPLTPLLPRDSGATFMSYSKIVSALIKTFPSAFGIESPNSF